MKYATMIIVIIIYLYVFGGKIMPKLELDATQENLAVVNDFIEEQLEGYSMKDSMQVSLVVEEIYINIANYAYGDSVGKAVITCDVDRDTDTLTLVFEDHGMQFDPLAKADPDITASAEEREIGGLGIFLTKKIMDTVSYEYDNGVNRLTAKKVLITQ